MSVGAPLQPLYYRSQPQTCWQWAAQYRAVDAKVNIFLHHICFEIVMLQIDFVVFQDSHFILCKIITKEVHNIKDI